MDLNQVPAYELVKKEELKDIASTGYLLRHKKTGAHVAVLENGDDNKVFSIGFRTPPKDSTGVAHIIEHSVLEGSDDFPVKDPFVELCKGSLNTFLNAMTFPDKTLYPVASCNAKDFRNLMHVYLDAVFHPSIYKNKNIFLQEGWHYELNSSENDLNINGIVYSEMKGVFSDPDSVMEREISNSLYPDTVYGKESGGDPEVIPQLTYEEFLEFHRNYYHPSNSYIYLYGNADMVSELNYMDEAYLSHFDYLEPSSAITLQKPFEKRVDLVKEFPISEEEEEDGNYSFCLNYSVGNVLDNTLYMAMEVLDYVLCSVPGAPVKEALIQKGIGDDVYSIYENGILQPYFSIVAKGVKEEDKEEFLSTIYESLQDVVKKGIDKSAIRAALHTFEFKYREADFGAYPKGLVYEMNMLDTWLYDEEKPFEHVKENEIFAYLKEQVETDYFEKLVSKYLLENTHQSFIMMKPVIGLSGKKDEAFKKKMADLKKTFSKEKLEEIVKMNQELRKWQETEDTEEALGTIPLLKREDITKECQKLCYEVRPIGENDCIYSNIPTNRICYIKVSFPLTNLTKEEYALLGIFKYILGLMGTKNYSYGDLFTQIMLSTGGIVSNTLSYTQIDQPKNYKYCFEMKTSVMYEDIPRAFELMEEILLRTDFSDKKRLKELISEGYTKQKDFLLSGGHSVAATRAQSGFSPVALLNDLVDGVSFYNELREWYDHFDKYADSLVKSLDLLREKILQPKEAIIGITADEEGYAIAKDYAKGLLDKMQNKVFDCEKYVPVCTPVNEALKTSGQVQYVAVAGDFRKNGLEYNGLFEIIKVILRYEFLWNEIRVKGGAYGVMNQIFRNGMSTFVSYRDPHLKNTIDVFEKVADFISHKDGDERELTKYIIGAIGNMDSPLTPSLKGALGFNACMNHLTNEQVQKERDEVLGATWEDIRKMSVYFRTFMENHHTCVVGSTEKIEENKEMFDSVQSIV